MRAKLGILIACAGLLISALPVLAHHSFAAEYDASKPVELKGRVSKVEWTNPHGYIYLNVKNDKGGVDEWAMEINSPNFLRHNGWTSTTVKPGDVITVSVWKETELQSEVLVRPDGGFSFALAGDVDAVGKTVEEIRTILVERLKRYIPSPVVTVASTPEPPRCCGGK